MARSLEALTEVHVGKMLVVRGCRDGMESVPRYSMPRGLTLRSSRSDLDPAGCDLSRRSDEI